MDANKAADRMAGNPVPPAFAHGAAVASKVAFRFLTGVPVRKVCVADFKPRGGQGIHRTRRAVRLHLAGAGAAIHGIDAGGSLK